MLCLITTCHKDARAKGLCIGHYKRLLKYGDPLSGGTARGAPWNFIEYVLKADTDDCILWPYAVAHKGYAQINKNGKRQIVSRLVCKIVNGPPPNHLYHAAHTCGKGHLGCINGRHLLWKSPQDNEADKLEHGTLLHGRSAPWSNLSAVEAKEIFARANAGESQRQIADDFSISQQMVSKIKNRQSWSRATAIG